MLKLIYNNNKDFKNFVDKVHGFIYRPFKVLHDLLSDYIKNCGIYKKLTLYYYLKCDHYALSRGLELMKTTEFVMFVMVSAVSLYCIVFLAIKLKQRRQGTVRRYQMMLILLALTWLLIKASCGLEYIGTATYYRYVDSWVGIVLNIGDVGSLALCLAGLASFKRVTYNYNKFYLSDILLFVCLVYPSIKITRKEREYFMSGETILLVEAYVLIIATISCMLTFLLAAWFRFPLKKSRNSRCELYLRISESVMTGLIYKFCVWELVVSEYMYTHRWEVVWGVMFISCTMIMHATWWILMYSGWTSDDEDRGLFYRKYRKRYEGYLSDEAIKQLVASNRLYKDVVDFSVTKIDTNHLRPIVYDIDEATDKEGIDQDIRPEYKEYDPEEDWDMLRMREKESDWGGIDNQPEFPADEPLNKFVPDPVMPDVQKSIVRLRKQHRRFRPDLYADGSGKSASKTTDEDEFVYFSDLPAWAKKHH